MQLSDFDFDLPPELIAQEALADRAASRMLVIDRRAGTLRDCAFRELPLFLRAGDCLVLNDTRVFPSRLYGMRQGHTGRVEIFLVKPLSVDRTRWLVILNRYLSGRVSPLTQPNLVVAARCANRGILIYVTVCISVAYSLMMAVSVSTS